MLEEQNAQKRGRSRKRQDESGKLEAGSREMQAESPKLEIKSRVQQAGSQKVKTRSRRRKNGTAGFRLPIRLLPILIGAIFGIRLYLFNAQALGDRMPMPFGVGAAVVLSGSMEPAYSVNDLIFVKKEPEYWEGDVVVYQRERDLIVHRIIQIQDGTVITQGDANDTADPAFKEEEIRGTVVFKIPWVGGPIRAMKTPMGTCLTIAAAILFLELSYRKEQDGEEKRIEEIKEEIRRLKE